MPVMAGSTMIGEGLRPRVSAMALLCFAIGTSHTVKITLIGEATVAEIILPMLALAALFGPAGRRLFAAKGFGWILLSLLITLGGYMLSDIVRETPSAQYLRGWGRVLMVALDFVGICAMAAASRQNIWWFAAGMGIGRVFHLRFVTDTPISLWKFGYDGFGYAEPLTIAMAAMACYIPSRWASLAFVLLGGMSVHYDFRIHSVLCLVMAGVMWGRAGRAQPAAAPLRVLLAVLVGVTAIYGALKYFESEYTADRRGASDVGRKAGKVFAFKAIAESPFIGYGSWSRGRALRRLNEAAVKEVAGRDASRYPSGDGSSATHAMILQAWVEGGLLAIAFFALVPVLLTRALYVAMLRRPFDNLTLIWLYFGLYGLWHITMSPFAAPLRVHLAFAAAAAVYASTAPPAPAPSSKKKTL